MKRHRAIVRDERGSAAVEFAIVGPIFLTLTIGMIYTCLLLFSMGSMQYAVEEAARCASVKTTVCSSSATTITYAQGVYYGPITVPTFTSTNAACGHQVSGSSTFLRARASGLLAPRWRPACRRG